MEIVYSHGKKDWPECDICGVQTPRMLKCKEFDKYKKTAHAFCIMNINKELIFKVDVRQRYDFEEKMPKRWCLQLFFRDTYSKHSGQFGKISQSSSSSSSSESNSNADVAKKLKIKCQGRTERSFSQADNTDQVMAILNAQSPFLRVLCNE